jgi:hypothetical protein
MAELTPGPDLTGGKNKIKNYTLMYQKKITPSDLFFLRAINRLIR